MKKRSMSGLAVLLVFAVFAVSVLLVLLTGADTVRQLTERNQRSYHHRTAVQYISTRIRQADRAGAVSTDNSENLNMLVLTEDIDGLEYETRIYCLDGYLRELFCQSGTALSPEFGEEILPMESFAVSLEGSSLHVELALPDGGTEKLIFLLRSEGGLT